MNVDSWAGYAFSSELLYCNCLIVNFLKINFFTSARSGREETCSINKKTVHDFDPTIPSGKMTDDSFFV